MKRSFKERAIGKKYLALVRGCIESDSDLIDGAIGADEGGPIRIKMAVREDGKPAQTEIRVLQRFGTKDWGASGRGYTWVEVTPLTGRTHQIRLHLSHLGHPLIGDKIYCDEGVAFLRRWDGVMNRSDLERLEHRRHGLHALDLTFAHPMTGRQINLRAPIPDDLLEFTRERGGSTLSLDEAVST